MTEILYQNANIIDLLLFPFTQILYYILLLIITKITTAILYLFLLSRQIVLVK